MGSLLRPLERVGFAKTRVTFAFLAGRLDFPPLKIRSFEFWARSTLAERAPKTNCTASPQFDLPDPFGPVIAVKPRSNGITASPLKDLKFSTSNNFRYIPFPLIKVLKPRPQGVKGARGVLKVTRLALARRGL